MEAKTLGIVRNPDTRSPMDLRAAVGDLAEVVWIIVDGADGGRVERVLMQRLGPIVEVDSTDLDGAATTLAELGLDGIVAFKDELLPITAALAQRLGLPGHSPETAERLTNKFRQRQALADAGVAQPRFWRLPPGLDPIQLAQAASSVSYPAVLKPTQGAASRGVAMVDSGATLADAYRIEAEHVLEEYMPDDPAQDPRLGSYVSVESAVSAGDISHLAISGRFPLSDAFRENGLFIPAALDTDTADSVLELAAAAIRALGVSDACLHIEVKLTPEGPKIIEVNGRVGGPPPLVLGSVSDVNLLRVAAEIALGLTVRFQTLVPCNGVGYWWRANPPIDATRVSDLRGTPDLAESRAVDSVSVRYPPGSTLEPGQGTVGVVVICGRTESVDEMVETIDLIKSTIEIDYETAA